MNLYKKELIANHIGLAYKVSNDVYYKAHPRKRGIHTKKDLNSVGLHTTRRAAQKFEPERGFQIHHVRISVDLLEMSQFFRTNAGVR